MSLLLSEELVFCVPILIHNSPYYVLYFTFDYYARFRFETCSEGILLHLFCDLPTDYQMVCVRNFIHPFENVRNFVRNCLEFKIISSDNFCPKIKCPKIKRLKILEINVAQFRPHSHFHTYTFTSVNVYILIRLHLASTRKRCFKLS